MGDMIVRERRREERGKRVLQVCGVRWEVVRRRFPLMRASGGQTIRCGESRKKEAEVEGRSSQFRHRLGYPRPVRSGLWCVVYVPRYERGAMGGELLRSSVGGDIGDIRCQWEVCVRGLG